MSLGGQSGNGNGNGAPTPPPYVRQLERAAHEEHKKNATLKAMVEANHLATMHEIGVLSASIMNLNFAVDEMRQQLSELAVAMKALSVHLGMLEVPSPRPTAA